MRIPVPFVGSQHEARSSLANDQLTVNFYPSIQERGAKTKVVLYPTPGLKALGNKGTGVCRGNGAVWQGNAYFINGDSLIKIDANDTFTIIGTISTVAGYVSMAAGRTHLCIVDGTAGYTYNGTTLAAISDSDFPNGASFVEWVDNYFIVNKPDSEQWAISNLDNATAWDALDFTSAERRPDNVLRPIWFRGDLLVIGEDTSELYYDSGNADFPWETYPNAVFEYGSPAPASAAVANKTFFMLAKSREGGFQVIMSQSETPKPISDQSLEWQLHQLSSVSDAFGWAYQQHGHTFYVLTFPSAGRTWVYDVNVNMWHERKSGNGATAGKWKAFGHVFFNNKHIVGDAGSNDFYTLDTDTYTDNTSAIVRQRRTSVSHKSEQMITFNRLEVVFEPGVGLTGTGQGSDPEVMLKYSDDGGNTWSNEKWKKVGKKGEYSKRAVWYKLGEGRRRIFEITMSDPVEWVMLDAYADVEIGQEN